MAIDDIAEVPVRVRLTSKQEAIYARIKECWQQCMSRSPAPNADDVNAACIENAKLFKQLHKAKLFPPLRYEFFSKAENNGGGHGKSRWDEYMRNGGTAEGAMDSVTFMGDVQVLVEGPDLPPDVIQGFKDRLNFGSTGETMNELRRYVRQATREIGDYQSTLPLEDAFSLLAVELGYAHHDSIRRAVMDAKRR